MGNLSIKKLRYALEAAGQGASGSPRHTFLRAHGTKKHRRRDRTTAPILIRSPVPAPAGMITLFITPKTVENHLGNAYRKLGVANRGELTEALAT